MKMFENLNRNAGWVDTELFYPEKSYLNAAGDAFSATEELTKLQNQCNAAYPKTWKGQHDGHPKAFAQCMERASTTINTMIKENTKLKADDQFSATVTSALGTTPAAAPDNTTIYIAIAAIVILGGGYFWYTRNKAVPGVAPAPAPAV